MNKVFISGMGIVSAIGNNVAETLQSLQGSRSGIEPLRYLKTAHTEFPVGEVKMTNEEMMALLNIPENTPATRAALMGMLAVREAIRHFVLDTQSPGKQRIPVFAGMTNKRVAFINGTTVGGMDKSEQFHSDFFENDSKNDYIKLHDCGACTEMIADYFGFFSQVTTVSTACSSAANAILLGAELLKSGRADIVVAGGTECLTKFHLNGFNTLMILDKEPCRPFDSNRAGLNLGEGAAYLVMISDSHCWIDPQTPEKQGISASAGKTVLAELSGYANACDAFHQTASSPDGEGAYLAMKHALESANLQPQDINYINAHGTGTTNNDLSEGIAIQRLFGDQIPPVSSTKGFTGHTTSAAGSIEAVISILALSHNVILPNLNFKNKMPELTFEPFVSCHREFDPQSPTTNSVDSCLRRNDALRHVLSNSFGFGGNDTALIFSKI
jgi:3-oxoacyl-[acyl-carrier-protein] synthase-1